MIDLFDDADNDERLPLAWRFSSAPYVLAEVAQRLRLPYSRRFARSVASNDPDAGTALGLVRAAQRLGLDSTPGTTSLQALDGVVASGASAVVFAFNNGSFGLIESASATSVRIWDHVYGVRSLGMSEFSALFAGLVVILERSRSTGTVERGWRRQRLAEAIFQDWRPRFWLAGPQSSLPVGLALLALLALLSALAAWRTASPIVATATAGLSLAGLLVSYFMVKSVYGGSQVAEFFCGGEHAGCFDVLRSRFAKIAGVPLSGLGLAFFAAQLLTLATAGPAAVWVAGLFALLGLPETALLLSIMVLARRICRLCLVTHVINLVVMILFVFASARQVPSPASLGTAILLWLCFFLLVLSAVVPHLVTADDWAQRRAKLDELRGSPWSFVGALAAAQPIEIDLPHTAIPLNGQGPPHELIVLLSPGCPSCATAIAHVERLLARAPDRVRIWTGVVSAPRALKEALLAAGLATGRFLTAYHAASEGVRRDGSIKDPVGLFSDALQVPREVIEAQLDRARSLAETTDRLGRSLENDSGALITPVLFFNRRRFEESPQLIEQLLFDQPHLLSVLAAGTPAVGPASPETSAEPALSQPRMRSS